MAQSQPETFTVSDIPKTKSNKKKYQRSLSMSQRIQNRITNSNCNPPPALPKGIVVKLPPIQSNIDIYEILPEKTAYQEKMHFPTKRWIHSILNKLNSVKKPQKKKSVSSSSNNDSNIPIYTLSTDLKLNRKCYQYDHFVSLLNIIIASCIKFEFLSKDFINFISDYNVEQFKNKAFKLFKQKWNICNMNHFVRTEQLHDMFITLFNSPLFILEHYKDISIPDYSKHNIDGLDAYKYEGKYITITSFNNAQSSDQNERNRVAAEFQSVIEALKKNRDKIGLSIFYSINNVDPELFPWCYIIKFKDSDDTTMDGMPRLEEEQKAEQDKENKDINTKAVAFTETIVIDDDDDVDMISKPKQSDKDENDDDDDDGSNHNHEMNGYSKEPMDIAKNDKDTSEEDLRKAMEASKISHDEEQQRREEASSVIPQDNEEHSPIALTFDETQINHDIALSDTAESEKTQTESPQRISSQSRLPATVPTEDDVEISLNIHSNTEEHNNHHNDDLDATLVNDDDDNESMDRMNDDDDTFSLCYGVSSNPSPIKQRSEDVELPQTILPDTVLDEHSENIHRNSALAATMMVDDNENEESLILDIADDSLNGSSNLKRSDGMVIESQDINNKEIEVMSVILSNTDHDNSHNDNNNTDFLDLDLDLSIQKEKEKEKEAIIVQDLTFSDESDGGIEQVKKKENDENEDDPLDGDETQDEEKDEIETLKEALSEMGFKEGLIEYILDENPSIMDLGTLIILCADNTGYYNDHKKKIHRRKQQKQKKSDNKASKRGKKRKRGESDEDDNDDNENNNNAPPNKKQKFCRNGPRLRSASKKKKNTDFDFVVDDESDGDDNDHNKNNINTRSRRNAKKKKQRKKKKVKDYTKNVKETESKMFRFKENLDGNSDIFKTKNCGDFEEETESDIDEMDSYYFPN